MSNLYFERYAYPKRFITEPIEPGTFIIIVIPVFKEEDLLPTLKALADCESTIHKVEVILVVNHPENASNDIKEQSRVTLKQIKDFKAQHPSPMVFHIIEAVNLPAKKAGVGLARKIGMDEAAFRLNSIGQDGVILCFDADSQCDVNYLTEVEKQFLHDPETSGVSIHYEHPLYTNEGEINEAIVLYELHLRYYIQALKYTGYPHAYHTIGSSMAVRSSVYQKQGGMNQRKAGEDFYFLHKVIPLGNFHNIGTTKVIPSARISDRVPFGTGRAMQEHQNDKKDLSMSYDFYSFPLIKQFLDNIQLETSGEDVPDQVSLFLNETGFQSELEKIKSQSKNETHFKARFFEWFNGFKMLKLVHYLRDQHFSEKSLIDQSNALLQELDLQKAELKTAYELLEVYRELDKKG